MIRWLWILTLGLSLGVRAQSRYTISGSVVDEKKAPLPGATVFLAGTKKTIASDANGNFTLGNLPPADYRLVIKVVGFKPLVKLVPVKDQDLKLVLQLEPDIKALKAVTVKPDKSWLDKLEIFKTQFLGESDNGAQCKVVNSGVLNFDYDRDTKVLKASTDDILIIKNEELGYQIKYVLLGFEYDEKHNSVAFQGYPSFEELKGTPEQESQWKTNRRLAYRGSMQHFIRSIYNQNCKAEGFVVYKMKNWSPFNFANASKGSVKFDYNQVSFDSLLTVVDPHHKTLQFSDALYVIYTKEKEQPSYLIKNYSLVGHFFTRRMPEGQVSIVDYLNPVNIEEQGSFTPTAGLYFEGYMGFKKIGDLVPYEYDPVE